MERVRQGGKLGIGATLVECGKRSSRLLNAIAATGSRLHQKFSNLSPSCIGSQELEAFAGILGIRKRQTVGRQVDQAAGPVEHVAAAL
jgi:hypothetical protein